MTTYYIVYQTTNKIDGKIYVGYHKTKNLEDGYLGSGKYLKYAIAKYGKENFERIILKIFDTSEEAEAYEREIVNEEFSQRSDTYNFALGGNVRAYAGKNNPMYGVRHSDEMIAQIQENMWKTISERGYLKTTPTEFWCTHKTGGKFYSQTDLKKFYEVGAAKHLLIEAMYEDIQNLEFHLPTAAKFFETEYQKIQEKRAIGKQIMRESARLRRLGKKDSEETLRKKSESRKGRKNPWNQKTNRDPEKIRKMAEKHRGMKRSEEAKANMKAAQLASKEQKRLDPDYSPCKGKFLYKTPSGVFKNPYFATDFGLTGDKIAKLCQFSAYGRTLTNTINKHVGNIFGEELYGTLISDLGFGYVNNEQ